MATDNNEELVTLLVKQIEATNRVNRAVRAIVIPSTITLITILAASPFLLLGFFIDSGGLLTFAGIVLFIGVILAIASQISESAASEMPQNQPARREGPGASNDSDSFAGLPQDSSAKPTGYCSCSGFERGLGNTRQVAEGKVCMRCDRLIADKQNSNLQKCAFCGTLYPGNLVACNDCGMS